MNMGARGRVWALGEECIGTWRRVRVLALGGVLVPGGEYSARRGRKTTRDYEHTVGLFIWDYYNFIFVLSFCSVMSYGKI